MLHEDLAVGLDLAAGLENVLHDLFGLRTLFKLDEHLQCHEVDACVLDTGGLFCGLLLEVCAVCAVDIDLVALFLFYKFLSKLND